MSSPFCDIVNPLAVILRYPSGPSSLTAMDFLRKICGCRPGSWPSKSVPGKKKCPAASTAVLHPQPAELPMLSRVLRSLIPAYHLFALHPSLSPSRVYPNQLSVRSKSTQFPYSFVSSSARVSTWERPPHIG